MHLTHEASYASSERIRRARQALNVALAVCLAVIATMMALSIAKREGIYHAIDSTQLEHLLSLGSASGMDSVAPMLSGLARARETAEAAARGATLSPQSPYERSLVLDRCKFQYPPSSWLLLELLPEPEGLPLPCVLSDQVKAQLAVSGTPRTSAPPTLGTVDWAPRVGLSVASAAACFALVAVSVQLLVRRLVGQSSLSARGGPITGDTRRDLFVTAILAAILGLLFYPLLKGHQLGNFQVFINLAVGLALLFLPSRPVLSGLLIGLCGLLKPQYTPLIAWALIRRRHDFAIACAAVLLVGHGAALLRYGLDVHVQYLEWLRHLSRLGEAFWANQSINGVLNRLLGTGSALHFVPDQFARYHPVVHAVTLGVSVFVMVIAFWPPRRQLAEAGDVAVRAGVASQLDLAAMLCAVTLASPIAWEHHYGGFLPVFALLLAAMVAQPRWPTPSALLLGIAFVVIANKSRPDWLFTSNFYGLIGAHLWFGACLAFALLLYWRAVPDVEGPSSPDRARSSSDLQREGRRPGQR